MFFSAEWSSIGRLFAEAPWTRSAEFIFVRGRVGAFGRGACDVADTTRWCEGQGLTLVDVLTLQPSVLCNPVNTCTFLWFARSVPTNERSPARTRRIQRVDEAEAFLTTTATDRGQFQRFTGRGSFGCEGGVFNPGVLREDGRTLMLARAERLSWAIQRESEEMHFSSWRAFLVQLDDQHQIVRRSELDFRSDFDRTRIRIEDFRLFSFGGRRLCNHSMITLPKGRSPKPQRLRPEILETRIAISELLPDEKELRFLGFPRLDVPVLQTEKNWALFPAGDELHLIYSMVPYRVLRAAPGPRQEFKTEIIRSLDLPFARDGWPARNSINPVDYDDRYLLHFVHRVYPIKQYVFWALLIDKRTLIPMFVSRRPVVRAGPSTAAAIVYACAAVVRPDCISVFAGIDDCGSGVWDIERSALDDCWKTLRCN